MNSRHQPFVPGEPLAGRPGVRLVEEPIFARILGQGRPLVLVHGLAISGRMFASVAEDLATDHQLVIPDLRGQGRSGHLPGPYTARDLSEDLAALLQRLDISRATVLGYSQGGPIAQQLAHDHPQLVGRLVLACTYAYNMLSRRERVEGYLLPWIFRLFGPRGLGRMVLYASGVGGGPRLTRQQARFVADLFAGTSRSAGVELARATLLFDSRPWLSSLHVPTLVIAGERDSAVPLHHARMLSQEIPGATLKVVPGAGHALIWTHPRELVEAVRQWEEGLPPD
jgi:3-oxoadipate enol-lactonase